MYRHAAISAAQPNSSLKAPSVAIPSCHGRNEECSVPCFWGLFAEKEALRFGRTCVAEIERMTPVHRGVFRLVSRPLLGVTLRGLSGARRHGVVLLSRVLPEQV